MEVGFTRAHHYACRNGGDCSGRRRGVGDKFGNYGSENLVFDLKFLSPLQGWFFNRYYPGLTPRALFFRRFAAGSELLAK